MTTISEHVEQLWADDITPALQRYIEIPNVSASYDAEWEAHGYMDEAVQLVRQWCAARPIDGLTVDVYRIPGRTPLIVAEVPASGPALADRTVLLYGHLDKQPEMTGWRDGLGPWTPVVEGDRLYGRGGADDGYAAFAALSAIEVAKAHGLDHARCVLLIEASEESGSPDLPAHLERLTDIIGRPDLVICLDSWAADTQRLWVTTSLRGLVGGVLPRRRACRGSPLRRRQRHRAVEFPDRSPAPRSDRGCRDRRGAAVRSARRGACRPPG